jgi:predicted TIM-barrel fold metal-dependent hydrolase
MMKAKSILFSFLLTILFCTPLVYAQIEADQVLLKNYRPEVLFKVPVSKIEKGRFPIIDMHAHAKAKSPEEVIDWIKTMDKVGIEKTTILSGATGERFDKIYALYSAHPGRFDIWCGIDYSKCAEPDFGEQAAAEIERCFKVGAKGVGEVSDKGTGLARRMEECKGMHADSPKMDPIWEKCAELGLPVNIHIGEPIWFYQPMDSTNDGLMQAYRWRLDNKMEDRLTLIEVLKTFENTLARHPKTTFIACHMANCCHDLTILGRLLDTYPNLYADISARIQYFAPIPRYAVAFINRYQDRLVFGTDKGRTEYMYKVFLRLLESNDEHYYEVDFYHLFWPWHGLHLSDGILEKLYRKNTLKIMSL